MKTVSSVNVLLMYTIYLSQSTRVGAGTFQNKLICTVLPTQMFYQPPVYTFTTDIMADIPSCWSFQYSLPGYCVKWDFRRFIFKDLIYVESQKISVK